MAQQNQVMLSPLCLSPQAMGLPIPLPCISQWVWLHVEGCFYRESDPPQEDIIGLPKGPAGSWHKRRSWRETGVLLKPSLSGTSSFHKWGEHKSVSCFLLAAFKGVRLLRSGPAGICGLSRLKNPQQGSGWPLMLQLSLWVVYALTPFSEEKPAAPREGHVTGLTPPEATKLPSCPQSPPTPTFHVTWMLWEVVGCKVTSIGGPSGAEKGEAT